MNKLILIVTLSVIAISAFPQEKWQKLGVKVPPPVCYASGENHRSFIPAPDQFLKHLKSSQEKKSTIKVTFLGTVPQEVRTAFAYAVDIWEYLIASPVTIKLTVSWTSLDTGVLGSCGPYDYYENFDSAPIKDCYYPVALVEKLEGKDVNGANSPDMYAQFNKDNSNWYFGTDGKTPNGDYDFVSVVLHEIAHGLGFTGFFYEQSGMGAYGDVLPFPGVFDEYVINGSGEKLVDTTLFANPSSALAQQFTSNNLKYKSRTALMGSVFGTYPRLFAPSSFDEGSSIYHLNESTYPAGNPNSLMTPYFASAEAVHDPGPLTTGILADMGWDFTHIIHEEIKDRETLTGPIPVEAQIKTDSGIDSSSVYLVYSTDGFQNADSIPLNYDEAKGLFTYDWTGLNDGVYDYYITVTDVNDRKYYAPADVPDDYYEFMIGSDLVSPVVSHTPITFMTLENPEVDVVVKASDNIGIQSVVVEYNVNNGPMQSMDLPQDSADYYKATLQLSNLADGDSIQYRIIATDSSSNNNQTILPESGFYTFYVDGFSDPVTHYTNDFNSTTRDFISADFQVSTPEFFSNGALNSPHPYPSPDQDNTEYNLTTILKHPIILDDEAKMSYDEVALVEPGTDSIFGSVNFYDYVIVEGSKNGKDNWLPLLDGYDSRANSSWLSAYDSNVTSSGNSLAVGKESEYVNRQFSMTANGNFAVGDTIFIRFRLFSDPYAIGWGWAIDNLKIQDTPTDASLIIYSPGELQLYPNPAQDNVFVKGDFGSYVNQLDISIYNSFGQVVSNEVVNVDSKQFMKQFDVGNLAPGLYLITFRFDNGQVITRKIVKQ